MNGARSGRTILAAGCLILMASCSSGAGTGSAGSPGGSTPPTQTSPEARTSAPSQRPPSPATSFAPAPAIDVPDGFRTEIYSTGLKHPTAMAYGPDGRLYVTEDTGDVVVASPNGRSPQIFASQFPVPLGLAWVDDALYVSAQGVLESVRLQEGHAGDRMTLLGGLPFKEHQQDNVVVGPDGRLFIGSGSTCNVCRESDPRSATVMSVRQDGSDLRVVATGLRNPFGLAFQPGTGRLYATVNGQDYIGTPTDPEPADMLVVVRAGANYGWPTCYPSARTLTLVGDCSGVAPPAAYLEPHSAAGGMAFYTGSSFPSQFRGNLFVAEWGEYLSTHHGRKLVRIVLRPDGTAPISAISVFASGFDHPLAVAVDPLGALLVADYGRGIIYRIQAEGQP